MRWASAFLLFGTLVLMSLGLVMIASVADVPGRVLHHDSTHFLRSQAVFDAVALAGCALVACVRPRFWFRRGTAIALVVVVAVSLVIVHVPGLGRTVNGSARWIRLPGLSLQPSEFVKVASIVLLAWWLGKDEKRAASFRTGALVPCLCLGAVMGGFLLQPDLGSCVMLGGVSAAMMFAAGVKIRHLLVPAAVATIALAAYVLHDPERLSRITSVMTHHDKSAEVLSISEDADGYQLRMGLSAFAAGGARGVGLGKSLFKERYLPENHTDFIFAMVGEELGLAATLPCLLLYAALAAAGFVVAYLAPDRRQRLLALGMTLQICLSAAVNVGVVTGCFPTKGLALPFLSYGGSSLVGSVGAVGFLLGIGLRPGASRVATAVPHPATRAELSDIWNE